MLRTLLIWKNDDQCLINSKGACVLKRHHLHRQNKHHETAGRLGAFTIIELLVVISIISLLIAILLPVLAKAKTASHVTVSLSNIRQVGVALFMYANDNKDFLPYLRWDADGNNLPNWSGVLYHDGYVSSHKVYWSPGRDTSMLDIATSAPWIGNSVWYNTGYGLSNFVSQYESKLASNPSLPLKLSGNRLPPLSKMLLMVETWRKVDAGEAKDRAGYFYNSLDSNNTFVFTYDGRAVRSFLDGHANANISDDLGWTAFDNYEGQWEVPVS